MTADKPIDAEVVAPTPTNGTELIPQPRRNESQLGIYSFKDFDAMLEFASNVATRLSDIITKSGLSNQIQGRKYVRVEGWTTMGAMLGTAPQERSSRRLDDGGYEAIVDIYRNSDGMRVGSASAICGMDEVDRNGELTWGSKPEYARKSMAITRATGKAYRLSYSWLMVMAGYDPTPLEEISGLNLGSKEAQAQVAERQIKEKQAAVTAQRVAADDEAFKKAKALPVGEGIIESTKLFTSKDKKKKAIEVVQNGHKLSCWEWHNGHISEYLRVWDLLGFDSDTNTLGTGAVGKEARFIVEKNGDYYNLVGVTYFDGSEWDVQEISKGKYVYESVRRYDNEKPQVEDSDIPF